MERLNFDNGIYDISNATYHESSAISRSALMRFKKSPYHYWYEYLSGEYEIPDETPAMRFGELVHTWMLEPDMLEERFAIAPNFDRRTKAGKELWLNFEKEVEDKCIITQNDFDLADKIVLAVRKEGSIAESLMQDAIFEHSIFFTHPTTGLQCKVRPDIWQTNIVADLKTTADASYRGFQSSAFKYGYYLQAAMIQEALNANGVELEKFVFIAVEKEPPFAHGIYMLDDEALAYGRKELEKLLNRLAECMQHNEWNSYGIQTLCVPGYAKFEVEVE